MPSSGRWRIEGSSGQSSQVKGKPFVSGLDATSLAEAAEQPPDMSGVPADQPALFSYIRDVPKPVIAAVNGMCAGGGFVLALMCDLRFAAEDAVFTTVFSKRGLIAEHATSWLLPRLVGSGRALDLLWSSRRVTGSEAVEMGLAERLAELGPSGPAGDCLCEGARGIHLTTISQSNQGARKCALVEFFRDCRGRRPRRDVGQPRRAGFREGVNSFLERRAPTFARIGKETE